MKKKHLTLLAVPSLALALAACGSDDETTKEETTGTETETETTEPAKTEETTIVVGASYGLHDIILEQAKPILEEEGITLEIEPYQDYIMPNQDLDSGDLDANYFQHIPYLEGEIAEKGYDFINAGGIHIEPMAIYSTKYKSVDEIEDGATVIISNNPAEEGRFLSLLEAQGLIKLKEGVDKAAATLDDIVENPKNLEIDNSSVPEMLVSYYENNEGDVVIINSNFAIDAGISPLEDSIAIEGSESPYVNVIATRSEDKDSAAIKRLVEVLHSEEIQEFILEEWKGAVVPVNE